MGSYLGVSPRFSEPVKQRPRRSTGEREKRMSALITSVEHALAAAASDTVKVAKFVETSVLPVLKRAQADSSAIEAVTALVSPPPGGQAGVTGEGRSRAVNDRAGADGTSILSERFHRQAECNCERYLLKGMYTVVSNSLLSTVCLTR
jgi:hypothetical protein